MIALKKIILFSCCVFLTLQVRAQTVDAETYIKSRLAQAQSVSFEFLEEYFTRYKHFQYDCVEDTATTPERQETSKMAFRYYIDLKTSGEFQFLLRDQTYGFDILFEKSDISGDYADLYFIQESLECDVLEGHGECVALRTSITRNFAYQPNGLIDKSFDTEGVRTESWVFNFFQGELYAQRSTSFEVRTLNMIGAKTGRISWSQTEVCHLTPQQEL